ncbi:7-cyano-7-deazaguanine synthase [Chlorella vulgaris]
MRDAAHLVSLARRATGVQHGFGGRCYRATAATASERTSSEPGPAAPPASTIVLVNGGINSTALLSYWKHWDHGQTLLPLFIDNCQGNAQRQEAAQQAVCDHLGLEFSTVNNCFEPTRELTRLSMGRQPHELRRRNSHFLFLASNFAVMEPELLLRTAEKHAIDNLAICLSKKNLDDCASEPFNDVHVMSFEPGLQVVKMGHAVGAPFHLTYSCTEDKERPCKKCASCKRRAAAFNAAGVEDTLFTKAAGVPA